MQTAEAGKIAGSMMLVGFHGTTLDPQTRDHLKELSPGGIILFARNCESPGQVSELVDSVIEAIGDRQLLVAVDQEGGRVNRLKAPFTQFPAMRDIGNTHNDYLAFETGKALGLELMAVGINTNLAPVLDIDSNPKNPVIGDRSFGSDPYLVSRMGVQFIAGLQQAGAFACGKHFPGHGDTSEDSHLKLPSVPHNMDRLMSLEIIPFANAIDAGVDLMMTAHVIVKGVDPDQPATLSKKILTGLLKTRLGFEGVVVTDCLEMKAIADNYGAPEAALRSIEAGADLLCVCHTAETQLKIRDALVKAMTDGTLDSSRAYDAAWRMTRLKKRVIWRRPEKQCIGCSFHTGLAREIREAATS